MGNIALGTRLFRPRRVVEERLTQPRRLIRELSDMDSDRLRRLIRSGGHLTPCYDAAEDAERGLAEEECLICFYFLPSLNRSKCCGKGICTECFLQLMPSKASSVVHCPFCKTASYAVEYRGARTITEKKFRHEQKQNVNEAKLRIHSEPRIARELVLP